MTFMTCRTAHIAQCTATTFVSTAAQCPCNPIVKYRWTPNHWRMALHRPCSSHLQRFPSPLLLMPTRSHVTTWATACPGSIMNCCLTTRRTCRIKSCWPRIIILRVEVCKDTEWPDDWNQVLQHKGFAVLYKGIWTNPASGEAVRVSISISCSVLLLTA